MSPGSGPSYHWQAAAVGVPVPVARRAGPVAAPATSSLPAWSAAPRLLGVFAPFTTATSPATFCRAADRPLAAAPCRRATRLLQLPAVPAGGSWYPRPAAARARRAATHRARAHTAWGEAGGVGRGHLAGGRGALDRGGLGGPRRGLALARGVPAAADLRATKAEAQGQGRRETE